jgi:hypothetical protein
MQLGEAAREQGLQHTRLVVEAVVDRHRGHAGLGREPPDRDRAGPGIGGEPVGGIEDDRFHVRGRGSGDGGGMVRRWGGCARCHVDDSITLFYNYGTTIYKW